MNRISCSMHMASSCLHPRGDPHGTSGHKELSDACQRSPRASPWPLGPPSDALLYSPWDQPAWVCSPHSAMWAQLNDCVEVSIPHCGVGIGYTACSRWGARTLCGSGECRQDPLAPSPRGLQGFPKSRHWRLPHLCPGWQVVLTGSTEELGPQVAVVWLPEPGYSLSFQERS